MNLSPYFHDLHSSYQAEIDDLRQDSEGRDVLKARLRQKRDAFAAILPMIDFDPVMVATVFHGAFQFSRESIGPLEDLLAREPGDFLPWDETAGSIDIADWAQPLIEQALRQETGEDFLSTVVGLEYALRWFSGEGEADAPAGQEERDDDEGLDHERRVEDYLEEQGFDRRSGD